ncbi:hypothetical protein L915_00606 [Phytophthora nicotianae]|nr:hypothetical protein L915_00606 [Phytophthora nicotianae]
MHEKIHNCQDNGVPTSVKKPRGKERKTKTVAGRLLTREMLQQAFSSKTPNRTRKPAKSKRPTKTIRDQRQEQECKQEQDIHQEQEQGQEHVLDQEEQQAEIPTTQSSHKDPVLFIANF